MRGREHPRAKRPEQVFFDDPAVDRLMGVLMALATEHYVLRDRVRALEKQLGATAHLGSEALRADASATDPAADEADATEFAESLLRPLLGLQEAQGASGEFTLRHVNGQQKS
jgi:hypothetical protein